MFLKLAHTKLDVFKASDDFVVECYRILKIFPPEEKFSMVAQIRRAALSVHLNIAEGCSRRSEAERKKFYQIARGSLIEVDTALDIALKPDYFNGEQGQTLGEKISTTFKILCGLIGKQA